VGTREDPERRATSRNMACESLAFLRGNKHRDVMEETVLKLPIWKMEVERVIKLRYTLSRQMERAVAISPQNFKLIIFVVLEYKYINIRLRGVKNRNTENSEAQLWGF
jgi:hypothetical protein